MIKPLLSNVLCELLLTISFYQCWGSYLKMKTATAKQNKPGWVSAAAGRQGLEAG